MCFPFATQGRDRKQARNSSITPAATYPHCYAFSHPPTYMSWEQGSEGRRRKKEKEQGTGGRQEDCATFRAAALCFLSPISPSIPTFYPSQLFITLALAFGFALLHACALRLAYRCHGIALSGAALATLRDERSGAAHSDPLPPARHSLFLTKEGRAPLNWRDGTVFFAAARFPLPNIADIRAVFRQRRRRLPTL